MRGLVSRALIAMLLCVQGCGGPRTDDSAPSFSVESVDGAFVIVLRGVDVARAGDDALSESEWRDLVAIHVVDADSAASASQPNVLGEYRPIVGGVMFTPRFPLSRNTAYRARYGPYEEMLTLPAETPREPTRVVQIYPTTDVVPANLLKFYVQFSAPMSRGHRYDFVRLIDEDGHEVTDPFPRIGVELWDPNQEQFTLLLDPGRIKRGIRINETMGLPLVPGKTYRMVIDGNWPDATGAPLAEAFVKEFRVVDPDHTSPRYSDWEISPPEAQSSLPLFIDFGEAMDVALSDRFIWVEDDEGNMLEGGVTLGASETRWAFTLADGVWDRGAYTIGIHSRLEDLAGNQIEKPFEVDTESDSAEGGIQVYSVPFEIE